MTHKTKNNLSLCRIIRHWKVCFDTLPCSEASLADFLKQGERAHPLFLLSFVTIKYATV